MNRTATLLPRRIEGENGKKALLSAGLIFHDPESPGDTHQLVTLPSGWSYPKHWGNLLDHRGHTRAWIHSNSNPPYIAVTSRFTVGTLSVTNGTHVHLISAIVKDELAAISDGVRLIADGYVFRTKPQAMAERSILRYMPLNKLVAEEILVGTHEELSRWKELKIAEAKAWLIERFPDWEDTSKYWD